VTQWALLSSSSIDSATRSAAHGSHPDSRPRPDARWRTDPPAIRRPGRALQQCWQDGRVPSRPQALPDRVRAALARTGAAVATEPEVLVGMATDWTGSWTGQVLAAVTPGSDVQVGAVLQVAREAGLPVQVQGGNTGLVGGSVPDRPSILLRTVGLRSVGPVDPAERTVRAGAGVTLAQLAGHAARSGLRFGVDLAARDSATIGGMVATNAGGLGVCAYGMMREQVRGLRAVLADGRVVDTLGRPAKDNVGYDLTGLLVGSEGTLGVVTDVEVGLHPAPPAPTVALLAVADLAGAVSIARAVQDRGTLLLAAEAVDAAGTARAAAASGRRDPLGGGGGWLLLLEVADGGTAEGLAAVAGEALAVATSSADRRRLWQLRERQTELYASAPGLAKLDVSVRLDRLDAAVAAIRRVVAAGPGSVGLFGHVLDGNLHVQLLDTPPGTVAAVLQEVAGLGGSISAEHGIGRLKVPHVHLARSPELVAWMAQIRAAVDPAGMLNPGVLFEDRRARPPR
jgi:FAD/FMN-containing dehydrogenase